MTLTDEEDAFFHFVLSRRPEWRPYLSALAKGSGETTNAALTVESPTEDPFLAIILWLSHGDPSVGFGGWHAHFTSHEAAWTSVRAIEEGLLVVATDIGGEFDGSRGILDLREEDAVLAYLTHRCGPPRVRIHSFSGEVDETYP
ncbi:MAG: hypothetical protein AB8H86_01370 [Polyangiales bacterium]